MNMNKYFYEDRDEFSTVHDLIDRGYKKYPDKIYCRYLLNGIERTKTYSEMYQYAVSTGIFLSGLVTSSRHIALLGNSSFEWFTSYYGLLYSGIVAVPIDKQLSREELLRQINFADVEILLYGGEYTDIAKYIVENSECCRLSFCFDKTESDDIYLYDVLPPYLDSDCHIAAPDPSSIAEIIFTSGTTGIGKGVMLSHGNIVSSVKFGIRIVNPTPDDVLLSIMPNNHSYELTVGIISPIYFGVSIAINDNMRRLIKNFSLFKPTIMLVVPALLKMIQKEIFSSAKKQKKLLLFHSAVSVSRFFHIFGIDLSRKMFKDVYSTLGGSLKTIICGGSFLSGDLIEFYKDIGINVIQGYGITECSPIVSAFNERYAKKGSVGKVGPYCKVKCVDGEICVSGSNVMLGYYKNPELTADIIRDGWFYTGDLGYVDKNGFIKLTGRKKNLIILSNGENVSPEELEDHLINLAIVDSVAVYEENDKIAVEIFPSESYISDNNITDIAGVIRESVYKVNSSLPPYKHMQIIKVRSVQFERTTTLKIKRESLNGNSEAVQTVIFI